MSEIEKPDVIGATRRAETIRQGMVSYAAALEAIGEAYENRDWVALGHKDWDTYCEKEFSERRLKLTREQRDQAVLAFRHAGMSIRAIGSALGLPKSSVADALAQVSEPGHLPTAVTGADGKTYAASKPAGAEAAQTEPPADPLTQFPAVEDAVNQHFANQTSGLADDTSPVDESGEDRPAPPSPGEAGDGGPSPAADVSIPSAPQTGDGSSPDESKPVDGQPQVGLGVTQPAAVPEAPASPIVQWAQGSTEHKAAALRKELHGFMAAGWALMNTIGPDEIAPFLKPQVIEDVESFRRAFNTWVDATIANHQKYTRPRLVREA